MNEKRMNKDVQMQQQEGQTEQLDHPKIDYIEDEWGVISISYSYSYML